MADSAAVDHTHWGAITALLAGSVVAAFQVGKLPAAIPDLRADLGLSLVTAGWVISTISGVGVATGMAWGFLADRIGHRRIILGGLGLLAAGSFAGAWAQTGSMLLVTRLLESIGYIAILAATPTLVGRLSTPRITASSPRFGRSISRSACPRWFSCRQGCSTRYHGAACGSVMPRSLC